MKVKKLIQELQKLNPEYEVVIAKQPGADAGFTPFDWASEEMYVPESTYAGNVPHPEDMDEDEYMLNSVVLWGVN